MELNYINLGKNIRQARLNMRLTQAELAEKIDLSTVFISQMENGTRKASLETIYKLSITLRCSVDDLLKKEPIDNSTMEYKELCAWLQYCTPKELRLITEVIRVIINNIQEDRLS